MSAAAKRKLSTAQKRIASAIAKMEREGAPAFVSALVDSLDYSAESGLTPTLKLMQSSGYLEIQGGGEKGKPRFVSLTPKGRHAVGAGGLPLLGSIPAGKLSECLLEPDTFVDEREMLAWRDGDFLLRVKGDSMIGDGILDGDKVLLRPDVEPHSGEIAAVEVGEDQEATLKHIIPVQQGKKVILRASNPAYPDIEVSSRRLHVAGVLRGLIREFQRAA